jgi:hypothetical protein
LLLLILMGLLLLLYMLWLLLLLLQNCQWSAAKAKLLGPTPPATASLSSKLPAHMAHLLPAVLNPASCAKRA